MAEVIDVWECKECGKLYHERVSCWCCVNPDGDYVGINKEYKIEHIGTLTAEEVKSLMKMDL